MKRSNLPQGLKCYNEIARPSIVALGTNNEPIQLVPNLTTWLQGKLLLGVKLATSNFKYTFPLSICSALRYKLLQIRNILFNLIIEESKVFSI